MEFETLRQIRRALSVAVSVAALALVMAALQAPSDAGKSPVGLLASLGLTVTLGALVVVWRKELALGEAAAQERERALLTLLTLQAELAKKKARPASDESGSKLDSE